MQKVMIAADLGTGLPVGQAFCDFVAPRGSFFFVGGGVSPSFLFNSGVPSGFPLGFPFFFSGFLLRRKGPGGAGGGAAGPLGWRKLRGRRVELGRWRRWPKVSRRGDPDGRSEEKARGLGEGGEGGRM